jgi:aryl-alcohol dehydrogenase-like predicted oxidoreductase
MAQLQEDIGSIDLTLSDELLEQIEAIHTEHPYPSP